MQDYELEGKAKAASELISPSELHGLVCGLAAVGGEEFPFSEFVQLAGADALTDEESVGAFVSDSLQALYAPDLTFAPLVPDDDEPLSVRVQGLGEWCAGFLSGFGAAIPEGATANSLPLDVQEILKDLVSISGLDDEVAGDEQDEASFMELYEYVKVGAVLILTLMSQSEESDAQ